MTLNEQHSDFKLTFEIAIIEHLGLNLYSEVHSAISELIANAYDAEATKVTVELPIGPPLGLAGQRIRISDDGVGMTFEECRDRYLRLGLNRRAASRKSKTGKRNVIGKKGIGKLAGFGIANRLHIRTIANSHVTEFILDLEGIRQAPLATAMIGAKHAISNSEILRAAPPDATREYHPELIKVDEPTEEPNGTIVTLEAIRPLDTIEQDDFVILLSRKFAIFSQDFQVTIVDSGSKSEMVLTRFDTPTQIRFPSTGWASEKLATSTMGERDVRYWIGFTKSTIKQDAMRGVSVIANGKSVQEPFEFKLAGGVEGQFGLQYMTGEVVADWLDEHAVDVVASDRASVRWSDLDAQRLLVWGRTKIKDCLARWAKERASKTVAEIKEQDPEIWEQIESYRGSARDELVKVVDRVAALVTHLGTERVKEIISSIVIAYRHDHVRNVLNRMVQGAEGYQLFGEALHEWDLINAVLTFQELSVKLSALATLETLIMGGATETKSKAGTLSLHEHLAAHPWLIDPMYAEMQHERNVDKFILEEYGVDPNNDSKRFDFVLLYDSDRLRLVEIKSAKDALDERGTSNFVLYHYRIKTEEMKRGPRARRVTSLLIYNGKASDQARAALTSLDQNEFNVFQWSELLRRNMRIYKEQLQHVRAKNPTDPRVVSLWDAMQERLNVLSAD